MRQYIIIFIFLGLFGFSTIGSAQITIGSGSPPVKAAILDLKTIEAIGADNVSADKGLLLPRVNLTDLGSLEPFVTSATAEDKKNLTGLQVYNMNDSIPFSKGIYIWYGDSWTLYRQPTTSSFSELKAGNGISQPASALRLGGALTEATTINLANNNLIFGQTTGNFSINTNALTVSGLNTGIGALPSAGSKLTVGGNMLIRDSLIVNDAVSSLRQTTITDSLWIRNPAPSIDGRYILKSKDAAGTTEWVPFTDILNYNDASYKEATMTGGGLTLTQTQWNLTTATAQHRIPGFELKLPPGLWLVYLSVVVEPSPASANVQNPIWGRFRFEHWNGSTYTEPSTTQTAAVARIGALNVSDRVYANVTKNVIKGYLILRINGTERTLHLCVGQRSTASGYAAWTGTTSVIIGDPNDPQNYAVAFPL
jgi:hypothetical protein